MHRYLLMFDNSKKVVCLNDRKINSLEIIKLIFFGQKSKFTKNISTYSESMNFEFFWEVSSAVTAVCILRSQSSWNWDFSKSSSFLTNFFHNKKIVKKSRMAGNSEIRPQWVSFGQNRYSDSHKFQKFPQISLNVDKLVKHTGYIWHTTWFLAAHCSIKKFAQGSNRVDEIKFVEIEKLNRESQFLNCECNWIRFRIGFTWKVNR